jgi:trk system potassium uptake protein TrkH
VALIQSLRDFSAVLRRRLWAIRVIVLGFLGAIFVGTILLALPQSTVGPRLSPVDALFTSTSGVCVTGLTVINVGSELSPFGQGVLLFLIQAGGLGIMTLSTFFTIMLRRRLSLADRDIISTSFSTGSVPDVRSLVKSVILLTVFLEAAGALLLFFRFLSDYPPGDAAYRAIFHSVSAFCNAGFSLHKDSFVGFQGDLYVNLVMMSLIILGGIGFVVLMELRDVFILRRRKGSTLSLHTKLVLVTSVCLVLGGWALFEIFEWSNSLSGKPVTSKILTGLFQSVTSRTAGFNTISISSLANPTLLLLMILMFIGAAPASTGGGIKVTTFGVMIGLALARFKGSDDVNMFSRRVRSEVVRRALAIFTAALLVLAVFMMLVLIAQFGFASRSQTEGGFLQILFEVTSAFGTVGLSTGITPELSTLARILVTVLMLVGRIGSLCIAVAIAAGEPKTRFRYAEETLMVG